MIYGKAIHLIGQGSHAQSQAVTIGIGFYHRDECGVPGQLPKLADALNQGGSTDLNPRKHQSHKFGLPAHSQPNLCTGPGKTIMKKLKTTRKTRQTMQKKKEKRALRSKAKAAHRRSTGFKEMTEST